MNKSLLGKAMKAAGNIPRKVRYNEKQLLEMSLAYVNGSISIGQASFAIFGNKRKTGQTYPPILMSLRRHVLNGSLKVIKK